MKAHIGSSTMPSMLMHFAYCKTPERPLSKPCLACVWDSLMLQDGGSCLIRTAAQDVGVGHGDTHALALVFRRSRRLGRRSLFLQHAPGAKQQHLALPTQASSFTHRLRPSASRHDVADVLHAEAVHQSIDKGYSGEQA